MLCLVMVLLCGSALAKTAATVATVDATTITTQIVTWGLLGILTVLGTLFGIVMKTYVVPWINAVAVPWLKQHNLLVAAQVALEYAEAVVGRFNGEEKLKLALTVLESKGWDIDSDTVLQAVKAKWLELNLAQVAAGVKEAVNSEAASVVETATGKLAQTV